MTNPPDDEPTPPTASPGETLGNAWVDGASEDSAAPLDRIEAQRAADVSLLHTLLEQALRPDAAAREIRVQRVAASVRETVMPAAPATVPTRRRWLATLTTVAAVLMAGVLLRNTFNPRTTATAAVDTALKAATVETDRAYRVQTDLRLPDGAPKELTADLWVRGGSQFVVRQDVPWGDLYLGSDGVDHWVIRPVGPVLTGPEPGLIEQWLLRDQLSLPFLQVATLLQRLADRYDLKLGPAAEIVTAEGAKPVWCTQVVGTKRDASDLLAPDVIRLWTARQSGVAQQVELLWNRPEDQPGVSRVTLRLQPLAAELPADWYRHEAHHDPDRRASRRG
ncbi:MAG: hypothetical protein SH850_14990, partial [Planctomycetaceae bacterium]|nr:hypothetical protein [Planctomycetaceae bacterium]